MTCVAWKDSVLAADSKVSVGNWNFGHQRKLVQVNDWVYASAGPMTVSAAVQRWLMSGLKQQFDIADDFEVLLYSREHEKLFYLDNLWLPHELSTAVVWAIGDAGPAAKVAMMCGKSALDAVHIACDMHAGAARPVYGFNVMDWTLIA